MTIVIIFLYVGRCLDNELRTIRSTPKEYYDCPFYISFQSQRVKASKMKSK